MQYRILRHARAFPQAWVVVSILLTCLGVTQAGQETSYTPVEVARVDIQIILATDPASPEPRKDPPPVVHPPVKIHGEIRVMGKPISVHGTLKRIEEHRFTRGLMGVEDSDTRRDPAQTLAMIDYDDEHIIHLEQDRNAPNPYRQ